MLFALAMTIINFFINNRYAINVQVSVFARSDYRTRNFIFIDFLIKSDINMEEILLPAVSYQKMEWR